MEQQAYWLGRKRASLKSASAAASAEARLIHYDLAGRYSVKANAAQTRAVDLADSLPPPIYAAGPDFVPEDSDDA